MMEKKKKDENIFFIKYINYYNIFLKYYFKSKMEKK